LITYDRVDLKFDLLFISRKQV